MPTQQEYDLNNLKASSGYDAHKVPMQTYIYAIESKNENLSQAIKETLLEKMDINNWINSTGKANILSIAISLNDYDFAKKIIETIGVAKLEKLFQKALSDSENSQSNFFNILLKNSNISHFVLDYIKNDFQSREVRYAVLKTLVNKGNVEQTEKYLNYNVNFLDSIKINKNLTSPLIYAQDIKMIKYLTDKGLNIQDPLSLSNKHDDSMRVIDYLIISQFSQISTLLIRFGSKKDFNPTQVNRMKKFVSELVENYTHSNQPLITEHTLPLYSQKMLYSEELFNLILPYINNTNVANVETAILNTALNKIVIPKNQITNNYKNNNNPLNTKILTKYLETMDEKMIKIDNFTLSKVQFYITQEKKNPDKFAYNANDIEKLETITEKMKLDLVMSHENKINTDSRKKLKV